MAHTEPPHTQAHTQVLLTLSLPHSQHTHHSYTKCTSQHHTHTTHTLSQQWHTEERSDEAGSATLTPTHQSTLTLHSALTLPSS